MPVFRSRTIIQVRMLGGRSSVLKVFSLSLTLVDVDSKLQLKAFQIYLLSRIHSRGQLAAGAITLLDVNQNLFG